jgi:hypothetical protein
MVYPFQLAARATLAFAFTVLRQAIAVNGDCPTRRLR